MAIFAKINSDDLNAPENYFVRIDFGPEEAQMAGNRYMYYENPTKFAKMMNCSRSKVIRFVAERRTVHFSEYIEFNSSPRI